MKARQQRFALILIGLVILGLATYLTLNALGGNLSYFFSPTEVVEGKAPQDRVFRVGGMVEAGSVRRAEGDLTENAEYQGAQESRLHMEARINALRDKLSRASIVDPKDLPQDEVVFGCTVTVKDLDFGDEEEFTLVGAGEEDYEQNKILITSPLAQGMVGKKVGERAEIEVPQGTTRFEILAIRPAD